MNSKLLHQMVAEMRSAQPFTKFAVALSYGYLVSLFLTFVVPVGYFAAFVAAAGVVATLWRLFKPKSL